MAVSLQIRGGKTISDQPAASIRGFVLMPGYTKLFSTIVGSTIWRETPETCKLWVTMLALANSDGIVESSLPGLADFTRISITDAQAGLTILLAPDPFSRTPANEGRRIEEVDGGWRILNYDLYRTKSSPDDVAERARRYRQRKRQLREERHAASRKRDEPLLPVTLPLRDVTERDVAKKEERESNKEKEERNVKAEAEAEAEYCVARLESSALTPTAISIPLNDGSEFPIYDDQITEWQRLYPAVDVAQQLRNIRGWNLAHHKNRKTKRGIEAHIDGWLRKEQDSAARNGDRNQRRQTPGEQFLEALRDSRRKPDFR